MSETKVRSMRSQSLDLLRFPLAVFVVTEHMMTIQGVSTGMGNLDVQSNEAFLVFHRFVTAFLQGMSIIVALPLAYNMAAWLLRNTRIKVSSFLASASFFIYVSHLLICFRVLNLSVFTLRPEQGWAIVATSVISEVAVILLLLEMFYLMKRYTPSLLRVVAGRK